MKKYDLFISYSSKDRPSVSEFVEILRAHGLTVWFDAFEMQPGDRLRDRIGEGIERSRYMVVVLSEHSINAPWVRTELDSAMMRELDERRVVVIPMLHGRVTQQLLPADLRGKHYLEWRSHQDAGIAAQRIAALFDLEERERRAQRRAYLRLLREGLLARRDAISELAALTHGADDYPAQKAALDGLAVHSEAGRSGALLAIGERALSHWGMNPLEHAFRVCARVEGGQLFLAASLFYDNRYTGTKLQLLDSMVRKRGESGLAVPGEVSELFKEPRRVSSWGLTLATNSPEDISHAIVFGSEFRIGFGWQRTYQYKFPKERVDRSFAYAERRIPGVRSLFERIDARDAKLARDYGDVNF